MDFDTETINGFKKIITEDLAYGIFLYDWSIRTELEKHISTQLFHSPEHMKQTTLKLLWYYIEKSNTKSVIGYTEDDPALTTVVTWAAYENKFPFYSYNLEDQGSFSQFIEPAVCPCSLIIPYAANDIQMSEIIGLFTKQKVPITQVISMIEEHPLNFDFAGNGITYTSLANWHDIKNRITKFKNLTPDKLNQILEVFQ